MEFDSAACHARRVMGQRGGDPPIELVAHVQRLAYHQPESGFCILHIRLEKGHERPTDEPSATGEERKSRSRKAIAVGRWELPGDKERIRLVGRWVRHRTHGLQFEFEALETLPPADAEGLVRYFSSRQFPGVGATLARRIVDKLGTDALEQIAEDPSVLDGIRGLRAPLAERIATEVGERLRSHHAQAYLRGLGLGPVQAMAAVDLLGDTCEGVVRDDPYRLAEVPGLGFAIADRVALTQGLAVDDPRRLAAGVLHLMHNASSDGHSMLRLHEVRDRLQALVGSFRDEVFEAALVSLESRDALLGARDLLDAAEVGEESAFPPELPLYLPWLLASERGLAQNLNALLGMGEVRAWATESELNAAARAIEIELHASQHAAVLLVLASPVALLTGGPGVGKTTIVRLVVQLAEAHKHRVLLASPTGRAAKRLSEATERKATTIHRMLGYSPGPGFERGYDNPLEADLVIVDEISMLDVSLAHQLLKAVQPPTRLVLVGDPDQLPSVGAGNVLADLLASECVPTARLTHIYRQAQDSLIVRNAHHIRVGEMPELPQRGDKQSDFYLFPSEDPEQCATRLIEVVSERIPNTFGFDWMRDVQVIAPMYRGACGVDALNARLRETLGYGGREVQRGGETYRAGDRVLQTRNDYERSVFNGDMGTITRVTENGQVVVSYPEQDVVYKGGELRDLRPAFAITVHRSQGSEFPVVVVPLTTQHHIMLQRNLFYTAVTRARKLVVLVGSTRALRRAVENASQARRESALAHRVARLAEARAAQTMLPSDNSASG